MTKKTAIETAFDWPADKEIAPFIEQLHYLKLSSIAEHYEAIAIKASKNKGSQVNYFN